MQSVKSQWLYPSNIITYFRFPLLILTLYYLLKDYFFIAACFIVCIWFSDILDGYIARKRNEVSEIGKVLDPVADKLSIFSISLILVTKDIIPLWFFLIIVLRDILILSGGLYLRFKLNITPVSNKSGKIAVFLVGITLQIIVLFYSIKNTNIQLYQQLSFYRELLINLLIFISLVVLISSLIIYLNRFLKILSKKEK